jgi:drug/metabolite transporter (DMT)-like permease
VSKPGLSLAAFAVCAGIWSSTFLVIRVGNDAMAPVWACSLRLLVAAALLNFLLVVTRQKWPTGSALKAAAWFGFWEFGVSLSLLYWGERVVPSGLAAVLYAICPVMAMLEAKALGIEELNLKRLLAALIAFAGVGVIFWRELLHGGSSLGLIAIFAAACAAPMAGLMLQRAPQQGAVGANAVGALVGLVVSVIVSSCLREPHMVPHSAVQIMPIAYLAIASSTIAFVLFAWMVPRLGTTTVAFLGVIVPVVAVVLGAVFRNESFAPGSLVGVVIVFAGVTVALRTPGVPPGPVPQ